MILFENQNMKKIPQNDFFLHPALPEDTWLDCDGEKGAWVLVLQGPTYSLPGGIGFVIVSRSALAESMWGSLPALGWRDVGGQCGGDRVGFQKLESSWWVGPAPALGSLHIPLGS